jgi:hypothetical protein
MVAQESGSRANREGRAAVRPAPVPAVPSEAARPKEAADPLVEQLLRASRERYDAQRAYYQEGRITIDRFVMASERLMEVERMIAQTQEERVAALHRHVDRLKELEDRERKEMEQGKSTVADVSEALQAKLEAEVLLRTARQAKPALDLESLDRRVKVLERMFEGHPKEPPRFPEERLRLRAQEEKPKEFSPQAPKSPEERPR